MSPAMEGEMGGTYTLADAMSSLGADCSSRNCGIALQEHVHPVCHLSAILRFYGVRN